MTEILRKQRIIPPIIIKDPIEMNFSDLSGIDYPQAHPKKTWTLKPSDLYRKVKICGRCFQIYSFISSSGVIADSGNKIEKWNHSEKKFQEKAKEFTKLLSLKPLKTKETPKNTQKNLHSVHSVV